MHAAQPSSQPQPHDPRSGEGKEEQVGSTVIDIPREAKLEATEAEAEEPEVTCDLEGRACMPLSERRVLSFTHPHPHWCAAGCQSIQPRARSSTPREAKVTTGSPSRASTWQAAAGAGAGGSGTLSRRGGEGAQQQIAADEKEEDFLWAARDEAAGWARDYEQLHDEPRRSKGAPPL